MFAAPFIAASLLAAELASAAAGQDGVVFVEAEAFENLGGWVVDQQFMDQMGSPYVLAHGLGEPVADANTLVTIPAAGTYHVWVRTRDWVAPWHAPGAPGRFQVLINGKPLKNVFGTEGAEWHWQDGGQVDLPAGPVRLGLHDLTGFEGRCDAVCLVPAGKARPPDDVKALTAYRERLGVLAARPAEAGRFDLVVVGGGMAGTCAAVAAARLGLKVALIQDRPVLGGNNSSEVRVWLQGKTNLPPYPRIGDLVRELEPRRRLHGPTGNAAELYDGRRIGLVRAEKNLSLYLGWRGNAVECSGGRINAVIAQSVRTARKLRFESGLVADCTGHGVIGALAGADYEITRKGHMGRSNLWNIVDTHRPQPFPRCPWALNLSDKPLPQKLGVWFWESGFDRDPFADGELIRDLNLRAMYGAWDALKNVRKKYPTYKLAWAAYISGTRESRRLLGDVVLTKQDILTGRKFPDACFPTTWPIDLHLPDPRYEKGFKGDPFISRASFTRLKRPYWVPYRCLYSRNVSNLFMAGRDISVTHEALGTVRVMRTCGMMGEIVGMAASICKDYSTTPRGVFRDYLAQLEALMTKGVGKRPWKPTQPAAAGPVRLTPPDWLARAGENLARSAKVTVSGNYDATAYPPRCVNDGKLNVNNNNLRWVSTRTVPNWVELAWPRPVTIGAARFISGYNRHGRLTSPISDFALQYRDASGQWKDIPATKTTGNTRFQWSARFQPVTTRAVRLYVTAAPMNTTRLWELEIYGPVRDKKTR
ncbi:MAG: FAD-dependent oxidoreductase [Planctomycetes bacterium]|nr:FAD-dependent oxidoreductase [Planctomycetota bacterium]